MTTTTDSGRWGNRRVRYFLDDASQSSVLLHVLGLLGGACAIAVLAFVVLAHGDILGAQTLPQALPILIAALGGCFVLAGLVAIRVVMRLTHRYVGPALVMRRALAGMRHGDYGCRLSLRRHDYLKSLAEEIEAHRSLIARRDVALARLLVGIRMALDEGDIQSAQTLLRVQGSRIALQPTSERPARRQVHTPAA